MGQLTDPFIDGRGDTAASTPVGASSDAADGGATSRLFGTAAGADYRFSAYKLAGFALAGGGANFSVIYGDAGRGGFAGVSRSHAGGGVVSHVW